MWTVALIALVVVYVGALTGSFVVAATHTVTIDHVAGPTMLLFSIVALACAVRASTHPDLDDGSRRAWRAVAASFTLLLATPVLFLITGPQPFPAPGDGTHLGFALALLIALPMFPLRATSRRERYKLILDAATVLAGGAMVLWYLVVGPYISARGASVDVVVAAAAYPVADLALMFGIAMVLLRGADRSTRRPLSLLAAATLFLVIGDGYLGYAQAHTTEVQRTEWQFVCWLTMHFFVALAAVEQCRQAGRHTFAAQRRHGVASNLPYAAVAVGYTLMVIAAGTEPHAYPWLGLVLGGVGLTGLVVLRQAMVQHESHEMAVTDPLTGLANRARVHEVLNRALAKGRTAVLIADMDGFKQVNDTLGHRAGDELLIAFGAMMRASVLGSDLVGRLGGDEFAVVLHDIDAANAAHVAARISAATSDPIMIDGAPVHAAASIGIAVCGLGELTPEELMHRADVAMYHAKRQVGPLRYAGWEQTMSDGALTLGDELRAAAAAGELRLLYQPIVTLPAGDVVGVEALVRWQHPTRGLLTPDEFIPLAERIGAIGDIGAWVLGQACTVVADWPSGLQLNVNVSPRQLDDDSFSDQVLDILKSTGLDPSSLVLEITESAVVGEATSVSHLETLSGHGIRIALDDFGTGYSSLRYLTRLPVDILKIDRHFVAELDGTAKGSAVAQAVIRLGQSLQLDTVAEGIETEAQARELTLLGCNKAQGFYFARPMTPGQFSEFLAEIVAS